MCGIFGWHLKDGQLSNTKRKQLYDLLVIQNDSRGGHSWGVCAVDRTTKTPIVERGLGTMFPARYKDILPWKQNVLFGHTRYKTHGDATVDNAHPFEIGDVIGAHNGVLSNHYQLNREFNRSFAVDSQHIFAHINEGHKMKSLEGYGAIEYIFKHSPESVYLGIFNHHLSVWRIKEGKESAGIVWTSDDKHGKFAMTMMRVEFEEMRVDEQTVYVVEDANYYRTKLKMNVKTSANKWDWRRGEAGGHSNYPGYNPNNIRSHDYHGVRTITTYNGSGQLQLPAAGGDSGNAAPEVDKSIVPMERGNRRTCGMGESGVVDANTMTDEEIAKYFCEDCLERKEDCQCLGLEDQGQEAIPCPDCEEGFVETRTPEGGFLDYKKCFTCRGNGVIVDSAFYVEGGHNDSLKG